jgi:hypothetical protein
MSQAILISDNEVINSLYELNLRAYVAVNVTIKRDLESATQLLEHAPNIDAIIIFKDLMSQGEAIESFKNFLVESSLNIPTILMGEQKTDFPNEIKIKNRYDIKDLVMTMAKILELTAEQMATREVPKYFPIPIRLLKNMKQSHCEIFQRVKIENFDFDYPKVIEKETEIGKTIQDFIREGETHLYIDSKERLKFINKTSRFIDNELKNPELSASEKI